ncbi:hypothetical protein T484DRAFT_2022284 [Baffinella frigidus]|nr:hypothetical protein T484DRAFT_2022284 [Cryptophyta sp. CCMP2293]|mmetsp:Transcript_18793/g.43744  ORF Transcript_18793/g.43744 Transcript_18793/m.43744 type:complete len:138 (-) Transcript_18793:77-490(-)
MMSAKNAAYDEPHTSLHKLLQAVKIAREPDEAALGRHGTSDAHALVAHDNVLAQCRRKPRTSVHIQLLPDVEDGREIEEAAPRRGGTLHRTSDSHRLVAHDHVLVQSRRETTVFPSKKPSSDALPGLLFVDSCCLLG